MVEITSHYRKHHQGKESTRTGECFDYVKTPFDLVPIVLAWFLDYIYITTHVNFVSILDHKHPQR